GVGPAITGRLLAEMPELGSLDRRQIAALGGLAPWTRQSGRWKGKSFIGGGRAGVRFRATACAADGLDPPARRRLCSTMQSTLSAQLRHGLPAPPSTVRRRAEWR